MKKDNINNTQNKRTRGRPQGSKNKPKLIPVNVETHFSGAEPPVKNEIQKIGIDNLPNLEASEFPVFVEANCHTRSRVWQFKLEENFRRGWLVGEDFKVMAVGVQNGRVVGFCRTVKNVRRGHFKSLFGVNCVVGGISEMDCGRLLGSPQIKKKIFVLGKWWIFGDLVNRSFLGVKHTNRYDDTLIDTIYQIELNKYNDL